MVKIVISYRRRDSAAIAGRIRDRLAGEFGPDSVFMDIDDIPIGVDFRDYIANALENTDIMLVIIGPNWAGGEKDKTRIQNHTDPVRVELEKAFELGIPIWPVLVDDAIIPNPDMLPVPLKELSNRNAAFVDTGRDFHAHMDRLIRQITKTLGWSTKSQDTIKIDSRPDAKKSQTKFRRTMAAVSLTSGAAILSIGWFVYQRPQGTSPSPPIERTLPPTLTNRATIAAAPAVACNEERTLRSLGTTSSASISFVNRASGTRKIYWLDFSGTRIVYATLQPGQSISLLTYITHPWLVTDGADTCLAIYMPTPNPQNIEITQ